MYSVCEEMERFSIILNFITPFVVVVVVVVEDCFSTTTTTTKEKKLLLLKNFQTTLGMNEKKVNEKREKKS